MFIATLFTIARTQKQPRYPSTDEWIKKLWYIYTREYYSAIKKNTFESLLMRWMNLESIIEWKKREREKQISHINIYKCNLERWYWWTYLQASYGVADIENRRGHRGGRRGWGEWREEHGNIDNTICETASGNLLLWLRELKLMLCDYLEGWDGVGGGRVI